MCLWPLHLDGVCLRTVLTRSLRTASLAILGEYKKLVQARIAMAMETLLLLGPNSLGPFKCPMP